MIFQELARVLTRLIPKDGRPILVSSAAWPLARAAMLSPKAVSELAIDLLSDRVGTAGSLIMPTLVGGYKRGYCDLDTEPATTGLIPETFRQQPGVRRTRSVYSSYAIRGARSEEFVLRSPEENWGKNSHLEWIENLNSHLVMLGTHPTHCVYLHRIEWLISDRLPYRYRKVISGQVKHEGTEFHLSETLLVRKLHPRVEQDFTRLLPSLINNGMRIDYACGVPVSVMEALSMREAVLPLMSADPLIAITNRDAFKTR
jgi:aminoglycoside N3'-acetyltransferase